MTGVLGNPGFIIINLSAVFMIFILTVVIRMKDKSQIHYAFIALMSTILLWALGTIILDYEYLRGNPTNKLIVYISYIGLILTPMSVLYLGLVFAKTNINLSWKHGLTFIVPIISIAMVFTNDSHFLFYKYIEYEDLTKPASLGSYFLIHSAYSYICIMVGMGYLIFFSAKNAGFFSRQSILIVLGIVVSLAYNFLLTIGIIEGYFHINVIFFFFTFLFFYLAIIKFDFLNIVPIALQRVVDHISDSFIVIDRENSIIDFNKTFMDTFGEVLQMKRKVKLTEFAERSDLEMDFIELFNIFDELTKKKVPSSFERKLTIDDEERHFSIEITPLFNRNMYLSTIILLKDITEMRNAMETIRKNSELLTERERLASLGQLIGGIAHNLKTPLMSISGGIEGLNMLIDEYSSSIGDNEVTDEDYTEIASEMTGWIDKIKPHCSYISDIISTVKEQASQFNIDSVRTFTLNELVKRVELLMKHELKKYHCTLNVKYETDNLIEINGEVNSLVQIFDNLIINSIHAYDRKKGIIDIIINETEDSVQFTIRDYGRGIPKSVRKRVFKEMVTTKGKGGTGLGLYMSYATIKAKLNGDMWFETETGKGTTFYISLPYAHSYSNVPK